MSDARARREQRSTNAAGKASPKTSRSAAAGSARTGTSRDAFLSDSREASRGKSGRREVKPVGFTCPPCGRFVRTDLDGVLWRARTGSSPRFCSPGCRQAAYRRRRAGVDEALPLQRTGGRNRSLARRSDDE
jgi:hypothetical protein